MTAELHANPRIAAARALRRAPSRIEAILWRQLRGRRLDGWKFKPQQPVGPCIADLFCEAALLVVEADGPAHATPEGRRSDRRRDEWMAARGLTVLRFTEDEIIARLDDVLARIAATLAATRRSVARTS